MSKPRKVSRRMNKQELIFDWSHVEAHRGWKGLAVLIVAVGAIFFFSLISVRFDFKETSSVKSASVLYISDQDMMSAWMRKAEEMGPFPGRLEIDGLYEPIDLLAADPLDEEQGWNSYAFELRSMQSQPANSADRIAVQGQRYFPKNFGSVHSEKTAPAKELVLKPVLIPYAKDAAKWMPAELPKFESVMNEKVASSAWRFVLLLRPDGTVAQCLSLSGGREESLSSLVKWLEGLRFAESEEAERWMGLRVEFLNDRKDGTESQ